MLLKRLPYFLFLFYGYATAQTYPVRNVTDEYVTTSLPGKENVLKDLHRIKRDKNGLYWFEYLTQVLSFDGVNWRTHRFQTPGGKDVIVRTNDLEVMEDGSIWLATEGGLCIYDKAIEKFVHVKQKIPNIGNLPPGSNCIFGGGNSFAFISIIREGFFLVDLQSKKSKQVILDSAEKIFVPTTISPITTDRNGNYWGITTTNKGIWFYNSNTDQVKCSWKGEWYPAGAKRFQSGVTGLTYSRKENVLWICFGEKGILEKLHLSTGKSSFYSFISGMKVRNDTIASNRLNLAPVKIDREENAWLAVDGKHIVKLNEDITRFEYLPDAKEPSYGFFPEKILNGSEADHNNILLWTVSNRQLSLLRKRNELARQISFDTLSATSIGASEYENEDGRKNIFLEKGRNNRYFLLQQNAGRPKLICLDSNLRIIKTLLNDEWKKYPAYFSTDFNPDTFYVAIMRPGNEPLDFRSVVLKDFRVDLRTLTVKQLVLDFRQRVWKYGCADYRNVHWLFSNGYLYSYDPKLNLLDSLYICKPAEKGQFDLEYVKGYDYPTVLHKHSSTFWISFFPTKEVYKVNLKTRKIEKVFKSCFDKKECAIPSGVADMYAVDSTRIYFQISFSGVFINVFNDSITHHTDLFKNKIPIEVPVSAGIYNNWITAVVPSGAYFLNTGTGQQVAMESNVDFSGRLSQFNSKPLFNDRGELVVMSSNQKRFIIFPIGAAHTRTPGNVHFTSIKLNDQSLGVDSLAKLGVLSLRHNGYNSLYFSFSDRSIDDQSEISYEYSLYNGGDTVWNLIQGKPELSFSRLSAGDYQLLVRAKAGFDISDIAIMGISIKPPFWQRPWFIVSFVVFVLGSILLYTRKRIRAVQKNEEEKTNSIRRMAELELQSLRTQLNPHFMFNSLNAIQELILMEENEKSQSYLARFAKLLRMLLENADKQFISLQRELDFLQLYLSLENLRIPDLHHSINIDKTIDAEHVMIPNMILQPYIENALWHGLSFKERDRQLQIRVTQSNGSVVYEIEDNGVGRQKAAELKSLYRKEHRSKGMELLSKRFKLLGKEYGSEIETTFTDLVYQDKVAGTLVTIRVPVSIYHNIKMSTV